MIARSCVMLVFWNRKSIINFIIYCDRSMIYHTSVNTTNISKTADYIFSLMDKVANVVGEQNIIQDVTDNKASFKVASQLLMEQIKHLFDLHMQHIALIWCSKILVR